jgi:hypothetical protein
MDLLIKRIDLPGRFIKLIGRRFARKRESVRAETRTRAASSAPHRCRARHATVLCAIHAAHFVQRNVADPQLGPDRHEWQNHGCRPSMVVRRRSKHWCAWSVPSGGAVTLSWTQNLLNLPNFRGIRLGAAMPALSFPWPRCPTSKIETMGACPMTTANEIAEKIAAENDLTKHQAKPSSIASSRRSLMRP